LRVYSVSNIIEGFFALLKVYSVSNYWGCISASNAVLNWLVNRGFLVVIRRRILWASRIALDYIQLFSFPKFMVQFISFPKFMILLFPFLKIMQVVMTRLSIYDVTVNQFWYVGNGFNYKTRLVLPSLNTTIHRWTLNVPIGLVLALFSFV